MPSAPPDRDRADRCEQVGAEGGSQSDRLGEPGVEMVQCGSRIEEKLVGSVAVQIDAAHDRTAAEILTFKAAPAGPAASIATIAIRQAAALIDGFSCVAIWLQIHYCDARGRSRTIRGIIGKDESPDSLSHLLRTLVRTTATAQTPKDVRAVAKQGQTAVPKVAGVPEQRQRRHARLKPSNN